MKIGLLGGSFDPPHFGHLGISKDALELMKLDEIWWLPTKQNPLKDRQNSGFEQRLELCEEITKSYDWIIVKDWENELKSSYFVDLLEFIKNKTATHLNVGSALDIQKKTQTHEFFLLLGADNLINFHLWHRWQDILKLVKIVVFGRKNLEKDAKNSKTYIFCKNLSKKDQKERIIFIKNKEYDISSTQIRNNTN